jgi:hypothetical protein
MIISVILGPHYTHKRHFETINYYDFTWTEIQKPTLDNISTLGSQYPFHELYLDDYLFLVFLIFQ